MTAFNQFSVTFTCNGQEFNTTIKSAKCNGTKPALITIEREMIWNLNKNGGKMRKSFGIPANFQIEITGFYMIGGVNRSWGDAAKELGIAEIDATMETIETTPEPMAFIAPGIKVSAAELEKVTLATSEQVEQTITDEFWGNDVRYNKIVTPAPNFGWGGMTDAQDAAKEARRDGFAKMMFNQRFSQ